MKSVGLVFLTRTETLLHLTLIELSNESAKIPPVKASTPGGVKVEVASISENLPSD